MKTTLLTALVLAAFILAPALLFAQPPGPPPGPGPGPMAGPPPGPPPEMMEENRELMEQVVVSRLSRELELTDDESILLMRRFSALREQQMELRRERMEIMRELRPILRQQQDEAALGRLMTRLEDVNARSAASEKTIRKAFEEMDLNVWQQAKLEVFLSDFENQMRRIAQQARGGRPGMGRPEGDWQRPMREGDRPMDGSMRRRRPGGADDEEGGPQRPRDGRRRPGPDAPVE